MNSLRLQVPKNEIAKILGRSQSTISREIKCNIGKRVSQYKQANRLANERHKIKPKKVKFTDKIKDLIKEEVKKDWSPEQIAGRFKKDDIICLYHEIIYQYVLSDQKVSILSKKLEKD